MSLFKKFSQAKGIQNAARGLARQNATPPMPAPQPVVPQRLGAPALQPGAQPGPRHRQQLRLRQVELARRSAAARSETLSPWMPRVETVQQRLKRNVFAHVTPSENVPSIMAQGLLTSHGGRGGAAEANTKKKKNMMKHSKGYVFLGRDADGAKGKKTSSKSYMDFFEHRNIPARNLNVAPPSDLEIESDPHDKRGGRYRASKSIFPSSIIPMSLTVAFREPGVIGADYAPAEFVAAATRRLAWERPTRNRNVVQMTEDIRRAVHNTEKIVYGTLGERLRGGIRDRRRAMGYDDVD